MHTERFRRRLSLVVISALGATLATIGATVAFNGADGGNGEDEPPVTPGAFSADELTRLYRPGKPWDGRGVGDLSESEAAGFDRFPLLWLGEEFSGYNLQQVDLVTQTAPLGRPTSENFEMVAFVYGACVPTGEGERQSCSPPLEVQVRSSCFVKPSQVADAARYRSSIERGGAQAVLFRDGHIEVWSGRSHITIHAPGQPELAARAINGLRGLGGGVRDIEPDTPLAPPDWGTCP